ncbi:MAG: adenosylmethionine decarboxylase [Burkholderiales bacterium]|jgi:S-adenosylmethionine decarboxylase proenzyme|nr:adenosylmethionine decarboxylase [Burkholderiales bacterium]MBP6250661.1 adenosylmethionine decarboxylase [Leptothrix sp. (in: b-proteobacteria)]MBP7519257.1 adenosylmethionine decarboxylase [Leptothrix sp. (in: b-proteobacteria)]HQY07177.1 adenosylmethionine decarboxylase [Burkholderiaceae bacterium]
MQGEHLSAELFDCPVGLALLTDARRLRERCLLAAQQAGLTVVGELFHRFPGESGAGASAGQTGVTGVLLLAESHLAVHTWPELGAVTMDVFVCNRSRDNRAAAQRLQQALVEAFQPGRWVGRVQQRPLLDSSGDPPAAA